MLQSNIVLRLLSSLLSFFAKNDDTRTTTAGAIAAAIIASGIDPQKLAEGDVHTIAQAIAAVAVMLLGYLATKKGADGTTTGVGALAGAMYAAAGDVSSVIVGVVLFLAGYFTNKAPRES